jgi:hypothetical protein
MKLRMNEFAQPIEEGVNKIINIAPLKRATKFKHKSYDQKDFISIVTADCRN